eukprot:CAMPEP_0177563602 /NCGR_PEP_ID=MMETSP0369-20130122/73158_1 /TAXON_ID=447022 ORGANISM="Scrippsiella hangoei-like, Strain SHHI-4" /NCGR_SAMPLE_ID=MMETSP0369 /ASSEMBLY_ACC=CAM_ASM_000364 /LENGTH=326 /DNA_ID=CAMNT_0019050811 /DNA_START=21 /DNA_END=1002 /DNA_ORIENTATION=-
MVSSILVACTLLHSPSSRRVRIRIPLAAAMSCCCAALLETLRLEGEVTKSAVVDRDAGITIGQFLNCWHPPRGLTYETCCSPGSTCFDSIFTEARWCGVDDGVRDCLRDVRQSLIDRIAAGCDEEGRSCNEMYETPHCTSHCGSLPAGNGATVTRSSELGRALHCIAGRPEVRSALDLFMGDGTLYAPQGSGIRALLLNGEPVDTTSEWFSYTDRKLTPLRALCEQIPIDVVFLDPWGTSIEAEWAEVEAYCRPLRWVVVNNVNLPSHSGWVREHLLSQGGAWAEVLSGRTLDLYGAFRPPWTHAELYRARSWTVLARTHGACGEA